MAKINFTTINHVARKEMELSLVEYCLIDLVYNLASSPVSRFPGWCYASRRHLAEILDVSERHVFTLIEGLVERKFLEKGEGSYLKATARWYRKAIYEQSAEGTNRVHTEKTSEPMKSDQVKSDQGGSEQSSEDPMKSVQSPQTPIRMTVKDDNKTDIKTPAPKNGAAADPRIKRLIDAFFEGQKGRLGEPPAKFNGGAAAAGMQALLKNFSEQEIIRRMLDWFISSEPFIAQRSYRVEDFLSNFNQLKDGPIEKKGGSNGGNANGIKPAAGKYDHVVHRN